MPVRETDMFPYRRFRDEVDRLLERFVGIPRSDWRRALMPTDRDEFPAVNLWQDDENVFVEAELPGVTEEDLDMSVVGRELAIKGRRPELKASDDAVILQRECTTGVFGRVVPLPVDVNPDEVEAVFRNGVLTVTLAKAPAARSRHIPIRTASRAPSASHSG